MLQGASEAVRDTLLRRLPLRDRKTGVALRLAPIWSPFNTAWALNVSSGMSAFPPLKEAKRKCSPHLRTTLLSSRAEDFHLRALPKPCVNLSTHTAPDVRPFP